MISVIMSVYKEPEKYLRESIESIINQTYTDIEFIIIVDNPDYDLGIELIKEYADRDERIHYYINPQNIGLTASLNRALQYVSGQYVARMDADDIAEPFRLTKQLQYLQDNKLDMVGSSVRRISESGEIVMKMTNQSYPPDIISKLLMYDNCVPHPTWFVKKYVYNRLNGYREIKACEDYDFLLRALKAKMRIGICDCITLNYRINTSGISRSNSLRQLLSADYLQRNFYRLNDVNQQEIDIFLKPRLTAPIEKKYETGLTILSNSVEKIKNGNKAAVFNLIFSLCKSKYIWINLKKIFIMRRIKKGALNDDGKIF